jgi:hypothetical protein
MMFSMAGGKTPMLNGRCRTQSLDIEHRAFGIGHRLGCWFSGLLACIQLASAQDSKTNAEPPKLEARFYQQNTPFSGEITRGILVAKESQFSFVMPAGFRHQIDPAEKKVSLTSTNYTCAITAKIFEKATDGPADLKSDTLRARVLGRHKDAKVVDEFNASIESLSGPAFELEWLSDAGLKMTMRTAFVPYPAGYIEFTVQAPTAEIRRYDQPLNQLLLSFRTSPLGKELAVQEFLPEL